MIVPGTELIEKSDDPSLRAYVVWVPMSRGMERDVPKATSEVPDSRAAHYWDGDGQLIRGYREVQTRGGTAIAHRDRRIGCTNSDRSGVRVPMRRSGTPRYFSTRPASR